MQQVNKNVKQKRLMIVFGVVLTLATVFGIGYWTSQKLSADTTNFLFDVTPGTLSIGSPIAVNFDAISTSSVAQNVDRYNLFVRFFVHDLKGSDAGYYTTFQASDLTGTNASGTVVGVIPAENIFVSTTSSSVSVLAGTPNSLVKVNPSLSGSFVSLASATTFIFRDTGVNSGVVGQYFYPPTFRITVPAFQAVGAYNNAGVLTYTIIEN